MKETIPLIITSKRVKYLRINLTKLMQDVQVKITKHQSKNLAVCSLKTDNQQKRPEYIKEYSSPK